MGSPGKDQAKKIVSHPLEHMRVLGPPASGKTSLLIERFKYLARQDVRPAVITYSKRSREVLISGAISKESASLMEVPVYTYASLARRIIPGPKKILNDMEKRILLEGIIRRNHGSLKSIYRRMRPIDKIIKVMDVLQQNGVGAEHLDDIRSLHALSDRLKDIFFLYEEFLSALRKNDFTTFYEISWRAASFLRSKNAKNPLADVDVFLIEDFQDVDPGQFHLLQTIAPPGGKAAVNVFGDPTGARFGFRGTQHFFLMDVFPRIYGGDTFYLRSRSGGVDGLAGAVENLVKETTGAESGNYLPVIGESPLEAGASRDNAERSGSERPSGGESGRLGQRGFSSFDTAQVIKAKDEFEEAYIVAAIISNLIASGDFAPEEIAVVSRDRDKYEPVLAMAFRQHGIPLETGRETASDRNLLASLIKFILDPDDASSPGLSSTSFMYERLESVLLSKSTGGEQTGNAGGLHELLRAFSSGLAGGSGCAWMDHVISDLLIPMAWGGGTSGVDMRLVTLLSELIDEWNHYAALCKKMGFDPEIRLFLQHSEFFNAGLKPAEPARARVGLFSCHQMSNRFFPVVFLVGCSEMMFPSLPKEETMIPYEELKEVLGGVAGGGLISMAQAKTDEERMRDEYGLLLHTIVRATRKLVITAPERFGDEEYPAPSEIIRRSLGYRSLEGGWETAPPYVRSAAALFGSGGKEGLKEVPSPTELASLWLREPASTRPFSIKRFDLSAKSLRMYLTCNRRFFYERVLKVPKEEVPYYELGRLFHELLHDLCENFSTMDALRSPSARKTVPELVENVLREGRVEPGTFFEKVMRRQLLSLADKFFKIEEARKDEYKVKSTEHYFRFSFGGWGFLGLIDRMDSVNGNKILLIDYKTGSSEKRSGKGMRKKALSEDQADRNWQVAIYLWSWYDEHKYFPHAYVHYLIDTRKEGKAASLYVCKDTSQWESMMEKGKIKKNDASYVLTDEIEQCMRDASEVSQSIFGVHEVFEMTEDGGTCFDCSFKSLCKRSGYGAQ